MWLRWDNTYQDVPVDGTGVVGGGVVMEKPVLPGVGISRESEGKP